MKTLIYDINQILIIDYVNSLQQATLSTLQDTKKIRCADDITHLPISNRNGSELANFDR